MNKMYFQNSSLSSEDQNGGKIAELMGTCKYFRKRADEYLEELQREREVQSQLKWELEVQCTVCACAVYCLCMCCVLCALYIPYSVCILVHSDMHTHLQTR